MNKGVTMERCRRTRAIVESVVDRDDSMVDRAHIAGCATCRREAERARSFDRSLTMVAAEVSDGVPDPSVAPGRRFRDLRIGRFDLRVAPIATLAGAVVVGLAVAAIIGTRAAPAPAASHFGSTTAAHVALESLGLTCREAEPGRVCQATTPDHVHRVIVAEDAGRIASVEARIDSTVSAPLDLRGVDAYFSSIASAVLAPDAAIAATTWINTSYSRCGGSCTVDLAQVSITVTQDSQSVSLALRER